jgi:elongation factor Ts
MNQVTITTEHIKELRDKTGVSVMQCREALIAAGGDMAQALELLKKKSGDIANKKADRVLGAGVISTYTHGGSIGAMVKLMCETDFVARNPEFKELGDDIAMHVSAMNPEFISDALVPLEKKEDFRASIAGEVADMNKPEDVKNTIINEKVDAYFSERTLLNQPFVKNGDMTVADIIKAAIQKFGEKIEVVSFTRMSVRD